jgi:sulfatase maturation enzyme AslB (radical SAM superfamily)
MQRLAAFFGTGRLIIERLIGSGHKELATHFKRFLHAFMEKQFPRQLTVIPTMACQLQCRYCYSAGLPPTRSNTMTEAELIKLLDWAHGSGITRICIAGGEPTLYPHLSTLIDFADDHRMEYFLATNGLFAREVLDLILAKQPLSVSLHINPEIYHTSKRTQFVTNAKALADSKIMTALRFNIVNPMSVAYFEYLDLCDEIGVHEIRLAVPVPNFSRSNTFVTLNTDLKAYALTIDQFVATSRQRGIEVMLSKPFPLCLLALETAEIFLENGSFNACCQVHLQRHTQNLTVYPDMHFSACLSLNQPSVEPILSYADIYQAAETYTADLDRLSQTPLMEACRHCPLSIGGRCMGACLSYRVGSDTTMGFRNPTMQ